MQKRNLSILAGIVAIIVIIAIAIIAYILRPTVAPSGEIVAIPLEPSEVNVPAPTETSENVAIPLEPSEVSSPEFTETMEIVATVTEQLPTATATEEPPEVGPVVFEIVQSESQARFRIDEVLRGQDKTVVGVTNQVAGQILINSADPASTQLGIIQVNARTLSTDNENRNRAIRNQILDVDEFEFINFAPISIQGFPESASPGDVLRLEILGELTIRHVSKEVVFITTIAIESLERISGIALVVVQRSDFELTIPQVQNVAGVGEKVTLEIEFVAVAK